MLLKYSAYCSIRVPGLGSLCMILSTSIPDHSLLKSTSDFTRSWQKSQSQVLTHNASTNKQLDIGRAVTMIFHISSTAASVPGKTNKPNVKMSDK